MSASDNSTQSGNRPEHNMWLLSDQRRLRGGRNTSGQGYFNVLAAVMHEIACFAAIGQMYRCQTTESGRPSSKVGGGHDKDIDNSHFRNVKMNRDDRQFLQSNSAPVRSIYAN